MTTTSGGRSPAPPAGATPLESLGSHGPAETHTLEVPDGQLSLVLHLPPRCHAAPCVVACHGLGASKDSDKYLELAGALTPAGLALARFDFRGCGASTGHEEETTIATRIEDVRAVLEFLRAAPRLNGRIGLFGSSLGGFVSLQVAASDSALAVVTWNAPVTLAGLAEPPERPGIGAPFRRELATGRYLEAPGGTVRHLVIHGQADEVVPVDHGRMLHARAAAPRRLVEIPGADHRLSDPVHRSRAVEESLAWFVQHLGPSFPIAR